MPSSSSIAKRIRDLKRLLEKKGDNESIRKKLEEVEKAKEANMIESKKRKNSLKYHMVKFLERRKITRSIRSLDKSMKKDDADVESLQKKKDKLLRDLAYIMYYPMEYKYVALFPAAESKKDTTGELSSHKVQKIREIAIHKWQQDVEDDNVVDKVTHAMNVEYGLHVENTGNGSEIENRKPLLKPRDKVKPSILKEKSVIKMIKPKKASVYNPNDEMSKYSPHGLSFSFEDSSRKIIETDDNDEKNEKPKEKVERTKEKNQVTEEDKKIVEYISKENEDLLNEKIMKEKEKKELLQNDSFFLEEAPEDEKPTDIELKNPIKKSNKNFHKQQRKDIKIMKNVINKRKYERIKKVEENKKMREDFKQRKKFKENFD